MFFCMSEQIICFISGRVQLVLFRDFTARKARALHLTGTVENLADGRVKVVAEGEREQLEKLIGYLHRGSVFSHVDGVEVGWKPAEGNFSDFHIIHS